MTETAHDLFERRKPMLDAALRACATREFWSGFVESPSRKHHRAGAAEAGEARFRAQLGRPFELDQPGEIGRTGLEVSPYTNEPLGVDYPKTDIEVAVAAARKAMSPWRAADVEARAGVCLEMLHAFFDQVFENTHATMHTAGQAYVMAFSGSGANALDRGLEALAYAYKAIKDVPRRARWEKEFGRAGVVSLNKTYEVAPRGPAAVVCCATFPLWNAYPALFANLMTGNPVIMKPHPNGVLPVAMAVRACRQVLERAGFDPNLVLLAADTAEAPATVALLEHPDVAIVDYTGSQRFGAWIEENCSRKLVFTETAGCNAVVIESTDDIKGLVSGLANCLAGFSAQMCTTPQNIHLSAEGINTDEGWMGYDAFRDRLIAAIDERVCDGARAAGLCGAVQASASIELLKRLEAEGRERGRVARRWDPYDHPDFPNARTATPLVLEVEPKDADLYQEEHFAPVAFLIREHSALAALESAAENARRFGAIASYLYAVDPAFLARGKAAFADAGASLWCNMTEPMPINFAAAYSDYHVTGLNPAGNACLTDLAFVANRFRIIQFRAPANGA